MSSPTNLTAVSPSLLTVKKPRTALTSDEASALPQSASPTLLDTAEPMPATPSKLLPLLEGVAIVAVLGTLGVYYHRSQGQWGELFPLLKEDIQHLLGKVKPNVHSDTLTPFVGKLSETTASPVFPSTSASLPKQNRTHKILSLAKNGVAIITGHRATKELYSQPYRGGGIATVSTGLSFTAAGLWGALVASGLSLTPFLAPIAGFAGLLSGLLAFGRYQRSYSDAVQRIKGRINPHTGERLTATAEDKVLGKLHYVWTVVSSLIPVVAGQFHERGLFLKGFRPNLKMFPL